MRLMIEALICIRGDGKTMKAIKMTELKKFALAALENAGLSAEHAEITAEALVTTDSFGTLSHGTKNLYQYILKMRAGGLDPKAEPVIEAEGPAWAIINGNCAIGMVSGSKAMEKAIEKARATGISYVGVRNSCHFGAAGYYANLAASKGMIGICMSNADPNMAIPGSCDVAIGNNPFSFAVPTKDGKSVFLDMALSNVAALKVIMAKEKGQSVPTTWIIDEKGNQTTDPSGFPEHAHLQPMGAHKGYGLAVMVEVLSAVLTGASMLRQVTSWNLEMEKKNGAGHAFLAIDIRQMMDLERFEERMEHIIHELKSAPAITGQEIFLPGEMEWAKRDMALRSDRIELTDAMAHNMEMLSEMYQMELNWIE